MQQEEGNRLFKEGKYFEALNCYYQAIESGHTGKATPSLLNNISLCNIKVGEYEAALQAADQSIQLNNTIAKSHYRKATALFHLGRFAQAVQILELVLRQLPTDQDTRSLLEKCRAAHIKANFARAIETSLTFNLWNSLDERLFNSIDPVPELYAGPSLPPLNDCLADEKHFGIEREFIDLLIDYFKKGKVLPRKITVQLLLLAFNRFTKPDVGSIVKVSLPPSSDSSSSMVVFGDVHGQFDDFVNALRINKTHPTQHRQFLFNGDFVDRGSASLEILLVLLSLKIRYPEFVFLNRGNHEFEGVNEVYGFGAEVSKKYDDQMFRLIARQLFPVLPIAHIISNRVFVVHGGLSPDPVDLDKFNSQFNRRQLVKTCNLEEFPEPRDPHLPTAMNFLWSDPDPLLVTGSQPSHRGIGARFSKEITEQFLNQNSFSLLIRSHEWCQNGFRIDHGGKCITIFSAPNYANNGQNDGAFIVLQEECRKYEIHQYSAGTATEPRLVHSSSI